jgi:hypothetical protein
VLLIAEVLAHLRVKRGLEHVPGQLAQQPIWADQLDVLLLRLLKQPLSKLLLINDICSHGLDHLAHTGRLR